jgi:hypothetical protein
MRIFQFAKWWWDKNDPFNRTLGCFGVLWALPCATLTIWFGQNAFLAILIGLLSVIAGWGIYGLFYLFRNMWKEFNDEHPPEDIAIIRKLKGTPTPSNERDDLHEYY